ncbi:putative chlorophyll(ide) b reductase NYC1 [Citrus sinensis]|uniref:Chlorophyll(Ide) b reductase NYC1 n=1 Tax=Citrus sinensis TaxID=2711 RepID=A0ACB8NRC4_CITSI|nr:putative chlorophyll(ide) b reductase NYC1 [Citrus sinensis]
MVSPPFTVAAATRDPLYNGDSVINMKSLLDLFSNFGTRCFLNDFTIGNMCRSTMDIGSRELEENLKEGMMAAGGSSKKTLVHAKVCNCGTVPQLHPTVGFPSIQVDPTYLSGSNGWCNCGTIVSTNLVGSILCTREAMRVMRDQPKGGHIFNMDGAGSGGSSTPLTAFYGSTKCGLRQLQASLFKESKRSKVGVHTASPGMVLTDLLLSGSTIQNKLMFNIICELPETVAKTLVPRIRERALYAAEADRLRNWAENWARLSFTDAMEIDVHREHMGIGVLAFCRLCLHNPLQHRGSENGGNFRQWRRRFRAAVEAMISSSGRSRSMRHFVVVDSRRRQITPAEAAVKGKKKKEKKKKKERRLKEKRRQED